MRRLYSRCLICSCLLEYVSHFVIYILYYVVSVFVVLFVLFFFSSRRRHTRCLSDWSSDVCSSDLQLVRCDRGEEVTHHCDAAGPRLQHLAVRRCATCEDRRGRAVVLGTGVPQARSEERRVGKECRSRGSP